MQCCLLTPSLKQISDSVLSSAVVEIEKGTYVLYLGIITTIQLCGVPTVETCYTKPYSLKLYFEHAVDGACSTFFVFYLFIKSFFER